MTLATCASEDIVPHMEPVASADTHGTPTQIAAAIFAGFALLAGVNAIAIATAVPPPSAGLALRAAHHVFDAAETLGLGALVALGVGAFVRFVRPSRWGARCAISVATVVLVYRVIGWRLVRFASHALEGRFESAIFVGYFVLLGVGVPVVVHVATFLSLRPRLRFLPVAFAVIVLVGDELYLPDDYPDMHGIIALGAAVVGGVGLGPLAERVGRFLSASRRGRFALVAVALFSLFGVAWPPANDVRLELFRLPSAVTPWFLATTVWRVPGLGAPVPPAVSPWIRDRSSAPAVTPTSSRLTPPLPPDLVVVLVTIDALRAAAVSEPANDALLPTFARLKRDGVVFTHASAAGTETVVSLSALFSGLYYSEQRWTDYGVGSLRALFPAADPSPRFPQILSEHGVATANYSGLSFLSSDFGVLRGFGDERFAVQGKSHTPASSLVAPLVDRLRNPGPAARPLFFYVHLLDPHRPYDGGRKDGTDYERYLSEIAVADAALGEVVRALTVGFGKRWALFVTADHGEAFGEHGTTDHGKTLYEELLHVPLLALSPLFAPRAIDERVSLIDLAPTILDLFGVDAPARLEGQSLVPLLTGAAEGTLLTRPVLAEARLRRAITLPDGLKVIDDPRRKVVEAYDLVADPGESRNLFDVDPARIDPALAALRTFFAVHALREAGYETPYRP